jgi:hypothetical protein
MYATWIRATASATAALLPVWGAILMAGCSGDPEKRLAAAVPDMDRTMVRHLAVSDDSTLFRHARSTGVYPVRRAGTRIVESLLSDSGRKFEDTRTVVLPALERVAAVYESEFNSVRFSREARFWRTATSGQAVRLSLLRSRSLLILQDTTITTPQRIGQFEQLLDLYEQTGYLPGIAMCRHELGNLYAQTDKTRQRMYYQRALAAADTAGMHPMICQILGTLGHEAAVEGRTDSMFYYWDRSRRVAERHRLPDYSARIYEFYARHYETEGRLALAQDLLLKAQEVCRSLKGGYRELRFVVKLIDFYNDLECWEVSGRLLPRAALLEQKVPDTIPAGTYAHAIRARLARARYLMATGNVDDAEGIVNDLKPLARQQLQRDQYPRLLFTWSEELLAGGYEGRARDPIDEGLDRSKQVNFPYLIPKFHLLRAEMSLRQQNYDAALAAIDEFEKTTKDWPAKYEREWITRDVLMSRLLLARGYADSAATALVGGLARLEKFLAAKDASTHGYLWLDKNDNLRRLLREHTQADPLAAYGAELYWRRLYQRLGARPGSVAAGISGLTENESLDTRLRALASDALGRLSRRGSTHVLYTINDGRVVRFTAGSGGISRNRLAVPVAELKRIVAEAWNGMSATRDDRHSPLDPALTRSLRALALQLLPPEVGDARPASPRPLYISADGFLAALPFETLNVAGDGSYVPLLAHWDVVYLRRSRSAYPRHRLPVSGGLLVADPALSPQIRRQLSVPEALPGASQEVAEVAVRVEGAVVLDGEAATKTAVLDSWENVPLVYVAAHFLAHPEIPFLTLLPLADPGESAAPDAAFVDIGDVRAADLRGCDLAVLSGCATGAPYLSRRVTGPSFGDAVCDAGARQVIQTFWKVGDDYARERLGVFFGQWHGSGESAAAVLNRVRRDELRSPDGPVHPYFWAAFHIKLSHL